MKVLQWNSAKCLGGAELRAVELSQFLHRKGYNVCVVCRKDSLFEKKVKETKLPYISYHHEFFGFLKLLCFTIKWRPDIIHVHTGKNYFTALAIGIITSTPVVCHRRLMAKINNITKLLTDIGKVKIIAISQIVKEILIRENRIDKDKIKVIYNAIPDTRIQTDLKQVEKLKEIFCKENKKIIISIGNLYPTKGFDELIEVVNILKYKNAEILVLIVGEGKERKRLENMITKYKLWNNVKLLGRREDVAELLTISHCFVLLSYEEPFGVAFIEALACGKPVVGYNIGGVPEIIKNNEVGFLVAPHDVQNVANKIWILLTDEEVYKKMSVAAKEYFRERFSFEKMVQEIENVYFDLSNQGEDIYGIKKKTIFS
ncbi:MAG: glycosyltransferase family 4 protein [Endomicrobia bacterium]|nr:glycosyltransferase family 4 protein [Endomicrobiia bacterium]